MPSDTEDNAVSTSRWSNLPWKKMNTDTTTAMDNSHAKRMRQNKIDSDAEYNHYDDPKADASELYLPASSARSQGKSIENDEGAGILFGIEVVDGSFFNVEKGTPVSQNSSKEIDENKDTIKSETKKKKQKKQKQKKPQLTEGGKAKDPKDDAQTTNSTKDGKESAESNTRSAQTLVKEGEKILTKSQLRNLKRKAKKAAKIQQKRQKLEELSQEHGLQEDDDENDTPNEKEATTKEQHEDNISSKQKGKKKSKQTQALLEVTTPPVSDDEMRKIQTDWSIAAGGVWLHLSLCAGLASKGFASPTPVQASTLPAAIMGRRDIVGAAPTGSGKTLAYALPILHDLLTKRDEQTREGETIDMDRHLEALVLCPTRELALQVSREILGASNGEIKCGTLVGGLCEKKQKRVLESRPPVLVATPGRLWDMMSSNEHAHLQDLARLRFLVIDEADRMISQGNFPQLKRIFGSINRANPPPLSQAEIEAAMESDDDDDDPDRLRSLQGVKGEAKVVMLDDSVLEMIEQQRNGKKKPVRSKRETANENDDDDISSSSAPPKPMEMDDDEYLEQQRQLEEEMTGSDESSDDEDESQEPVHRQTFIYSATLTLPHVSLNKKAVNDKQKGKKKKRNSGPTVEGAIAEILEKAGARGQTKVVDLSSERDVSDKPANKNQGDNSVGQRKKDASSNSSSSGARLPPGLSLRQIMCAQMHKDSHLYAYLITTAQGSSGPCLVFCNSIGAVRRVSETLRILGLPAKSLHAQMSQKSRFSSLESLRKANSRSIVVATDVAARGLDISSVSTVVHYDVPRAVDTFIHRAGRTAVSSPFRTLLQCICFKTMISFCCVLGWHRLIAEGIGDMVLCGWHCCLSSLI